MANRSVDIRAYALAGAQARLQELAEESEQIRRLFPELRRASRDQLSATGGDSQPSAPDGARGRAAKPRRPRVISAEGRKRISEAQKARWAAQRAAADGNAPASPGRAQKRRSEARKKR
jgi:hypothetical protein